VRETGHAEEDQGREELGQGRNKPARRPSQDNGLDVRKIEPFVVLGKAVVFDRDKVIRPEIKTAHG
jgi:hypothetical protein